MLRDYEETLTDLPQKSGKKTIKCFLLLVVQFITTNKRTEVVLYFCFTLFLLFAFCFEILVGSPGWPGAYYVPQVGLELASLLPRVPKC